MNVVIITGASSGIGREFALQLDAGLYTVDEFWLIARREERLEELAARLDHMAKVIPMDLTSDADMDHFRKRLKKERPVIRMLINSSGSVSYTHLWKDIDIEYLGRFGLEPPAGLQSEIEGMSFSETAGYFKERFRLPDYVEKIKDCLLYTSRCV